MKWTSTFRMVSLALLCTAAMLSSKAMAQGGQRGPQVVSPEVLSDRRVTFRIQAPKASEITLWGDWLGSAPAEKLTKGDQDFTFGGSKALSEVLTKHSIKNELNISGGGHTWINWRRYLHQTAQVLFADSVVK